MKQFIKFTIALFLGVVALGFQSCGKSGKGASDTPKDEEIVTGAQKPVWNYESLTDEFGDDNGEKVISGLFDGSFSNSATDNSNAKLQVLYSPGVPLFRVFNYNTQPVKGENFIRFKVKEKNGNVSILYVLNNSGFFVPAEVPGTLGMTGIDSLLVAEQELKFSGVLLDGDTETDCLLTEMGYLAEENGEAPNYSQKNEANRPKYLFTINSVGLRAMIKN